jgi:outer membrane protein, heavy metal efflux system
MRSLALLLLVAAGAFGQAAPDLLKDIAARPPMGLEDFEQLGLAMNPTLKQSNALVQGSAARARQAGLYPNPVVGYQGEQIRGGWYDGGEQGAFIQQTFVLGGKLGLRRNAFEQQRQEDEIGVEEQRYRIRAGVGQSFYSAFAVQEILNVRRRLLSIATDAVETARKLANVGQADAPDVLQAEVEAEQAEIDYTTAQRAFIAAFYALAAVTGKPELPVCLLKGDFEHPPEIDAEQIMNRIMSDSPVVKRAQQDVVRTQAILKSAKRESVPDLQIHAGLQQNFEPVNDNPHIAVGLQGFATVGIELPIFNRNQGNVAAAQTDMERAEAEVTRLRLLVRRDVETLLQNYLAARAATNRYRDELMPRASRAYQLYLTKYQEMAGAYPQVLISQRTLFELQLAYIKALQEVWTDATLLRNYSLGSGLSASSASGSTLETMPGLTR